MKLVSVTFLNTGVETRIPFWDGDFVVTPAGQTTIEDLDRADAMYDAGVLIPKITTPSPEALTKLNVYGEDRDSYV